MTTMLRNRLSALRRQAGATDTGKAPACSLPAEPADVADPGLNAPAEQAENRRSLSERLGRMARARSASRAQGLAQLLRLTGARPLGESFALAEKTLALPSMHGRVRLGPALGGPVCVPVRARLSVTVPAERLLFLDTETSGLSGGTGTFVFLLGLAKVRDGALTVRQYLATGFAGEAGLLDALTEELRDSECLVTFNGKSFDVPVLRTRCALARREDPFAGKLHGDLLHASRRLLKRDWPDCRLKTTESRALGFDRTDDLPGSEVPGAWQRWLTRADAEAIPRILDHNRDDLISLASIIELLNSCEAGSPLFASAPSAGRGHGPATGV